MMWQSSHSQTFLQHIAYETVYTAWSCFPSITCFYIHRAKAGRVLPKCQPGLSGALGLFSLVCFSFFLSFFFKKIFLQTLFIYFQRGEGKERERKRNISVWLPLMYPHLGTWPATQASALTGNRTSDPQVCRPDLNPLSLTSQGWFVFLIFII